MVHFMGRIVLILFILSSFCFSAQTKKIFFNNKDDKWLAIDKVQHFMYSTFVVFGSQYVLVNKLSLDEKSALPFSSFLSFSAGFSKELIDKRSKHGFFSKKDMVANVFGIFFAGLVISTPLE